MDVIQRLGITGKMLRWLNNVLYKRTIQVTVDGILPGEVALDNGCPQGSVLSPILFVLFMNTFQNCIKQYNQHLVSPK